ncbi:zinc-binding alcohol dehydrogenase family protein [Microvirga lotononidis]|uniref:Zinc-type alcohol dehydrogenase-like protein n=1 Tax=Microvirga lotononidis TaxID=864069 RepID=I4YMV3_9HYPH|nr:zinc-binding alcohol dehydrogenase family protein [Microvirga lotononidis]EIM25295.1 zinc-binding alcohol dehydrogenase family protein [Microvirga lotononidis]WQO29228.1 zinc-binding alcohol dehydrogenase family protein [Microvirga lotononidis]
MRAVGYQQSLAIDQDASLVDVDLPRPEPGPRDLLVEIKAVSLNPVDTKVRMRAQPEPGGWKVLGFDAAGIVRGTGRDVSLFKEGDEVFYAGAITRQGTNAEFHVVDERLVGAKPKSIGFEEAAALPLTTLTAWETLFDRLEVRRPVKGAANAILIVGAAGGVGSIAVQLARKLTDLTVIATASRPDTQAWVTELGAHHVIDHGKPLAAQVEALGIGAPAFAFSITHTENHFAEIAKALAPQGRFALIDDPKTLLDISLMKGKSVSIHWESMFTRSTFQTADMERQHEILNEASRLVDAGTIRTTLAEVVGPIDAANLKRAHSLVESNRTRGKLVLSGF